MEAAIFMLVCWGLKGTNLVSELLIWSKSDHSHFIIIKFHRDFKSRFKFISVLEIFQSMKYEVRYHLSLTKPVTSRTFYLFISHLELWLRQFSVVQSLLSIAVASDLESSLAVVLHWPAADSRAVGARVLLALSHSAREGLRIESTFNRNNFVLVDGGISLSTDLVLPH